MYNRTAFLSRRQRAQHLEDAEKAVWRVPPHGVTFPWHDGYLSLSATGEKEPGVWCRVERMMVLQKRCRKAK